MKLYFQVFTGEGNFYVSDNNAGDAILHQVAHDDPKAKVVVIDRDTHEALGRTRLLRKYLVENHRLLTLSIKQGAA